MTRDTMPFDISTHYDLLPIIKLARKAILAEKTLSTINWLSNALPAVGEPLAAAGVYTGDEDTLTEDAARCLQFVEEVLQKQHEAEMEGNHDGT